MKSSSNSPQQQQEARRDRVSDQPAAKRVKLSPSLAPRPGNSSSNASLNVTSAPNGAGGADLSCVLRDLSALRASAPFRNLPTTAPQPVAGFEPQLLQRNMSLSGNTGNGIIGNGTLTPSLTALLQQQQQQQQQLKTLNRGNVSDVLQALLLQQQLKSSLGSSSAPQPDISALLALASAPVARPSPPPPPVPTPATASTAPGAAAAALLTSLLSQNQQQQQNRPNTNSNLNATLLQQLLATQLQKQQVQASVAVLQQLLEQKKANQVSTITSNNQGANIFATNSVATTKTMQQGKDCSAAGMPMSKMPLQQSAKLPGQVPQEFNFEGDRLVPLAMNCEQWVMSEYQCLLRQQIAFCETGARTNKGKTQGRNKPIVPGQVGIICKHCARLPPQDRTRGAVYYPAKLDRIYQAAQNMAHNHFAAACRAIPHDVRQKMIELKDKKAVTVGAGKEYWHSAAKSTGIAEGEDGLYLASGSGASATTNTAIPVAKQVTASAVPARS